MAINVGKTKVSVPIFDDIYVHDEDVTAEVVGLIQRLKIDANNLEEEAAEHPALFSRSATLAEEASSDARFAKRRLELAKAELDFSIRRDAAMDGGKKPTEPQIESQITTDAKITELTEEWLDAERSAGILNAQRQALKDRREMISELMRTGRQEYASYGHEGGGN